jgi:hypothetical protein
MSNVLLSSSFYFILHLEVEMLFLNEAEIDAAVYNWQNHPTLGPATKTLQNLKDCANQNSDGWCYWPKPCRAAKSLQELIQGNVEDRYSSRLDVTAAQVRKTYAPIKAFLTRSGLTCKIVEVK